jgi:hypothetical protein
VEEEGKSIVTEAEKQEIDRMEAELKRLFPQPLVAIAGGKKRQEMIAEMERSITPEHLEKIRLAQNVLRKWREE